MASFEPPVETSSVISCLERLGLSVDMVLVIIIPDRRTVWLPNILTAPFVRWNDVLERYVWWGPDCTVIGCLCDEEPPADVNCEGGLHLAAGGSKNTLNTYRGDSWQQQAQKVQFSGSLQKFYAITSGFCVRFFFRLIFFEKCVKVECVHLLCCSSNCFGKICEQYLPVLRSYIDLN